MSSEEVSSPRSTMLNAHDAKLLSGSVSSAELDASDGWMNTKEKLVTQHQQTIREQRIQKQVNEKAELVSTVRRAEEEKKTVAEQALSFQAMQMAMMSKALQLMGPETIENEKIKELQENVKGLKSELTIIKDSLSLLLQHSLPK